MKTFLSLLCALALLCALPASAQIKKMSNRKLHAETRRAERQARREARKAEQEYADTYLNMSAHQMKVGKEGRKPVRTNDGRDNYHFNKNGEAMVTEASVLTPKRLKRKK